MTSSVSEKKAAKILIVEDDAGIRIALQTFFSMVSLEAHWAETGGHALAILDTLIEMPTFILVDGRLPDMHGLELIKILRARLQTDTCIYLFSADHYSGHFDQLGINGFIPKPFDADKLISLASQYAQ